MPTLERICAADRLLSSWLIPGHAPLWTDIDLRNTCIDPCPRATSAPQPRPPSRRARAVLDGDLPSSLRQPPIRGPRACTRPEFGHLDAASAYHPPVPTRSSHPTARPSTARSSVPVRPTPPTPALTPLLRAASLVLLPRHLPLGRLVATRPLRLPTRPGGDVPGTQRVEVSSLTKRAAAT